MTTPGSGGHRYAERLRRMGRRAGRRLYISASQERVIVDGFRRSYHGSEIDSRWMGKPVSVLPLDLWVYQEILHETQADLVVALASPSASCMSDICHMLSRGKVLSLDPAVGASGPQLWAAARDATSGQKSVMVIIGSGSGAGCLAEQLAIYSTLVTKGSYLIVEDTGPGYGPEPSDRRSRLVESFLRENHNFVIDRSREKFYLTRNPGGFLRRR